MIAVMIYLKGLDYDSCHDLSIGLDYDSSHDLS